MLNIFILSLLITTNVFASIFGVDDRIDYYEIKDSKIKEVSKSLPALVLKSKMKKLANGDYQMLGDSLEKVLEFCSDTKFSQDPMNANCSSTLVGEDLILTSAHCVDENDSGIYSIDNYYIVFDYIKTNKDQVQFVIPKENVFEIEKKAYYNFDTSFSKTGLDIALLKLKRKTKRKPLKMNFKVKLNAEIFVMGYPLGVPQKLADNGVITSIDKSLNSFKHDLDIFSCNSGSGIINAKTFEVIGVLSRGTGPNYEKVGRECNDWHTTTQDGGYAESNILKILRGKL